MPHDEGQSTCKQLIRLLALTSLSWIDCYEFVWYAFCVLLVQRRTFFVFYDRVVYAFDESGVSSMGFPDYHQHILDLRTFDRTTLTFLILDDPSGQTHFQPPMFLSKTLAYILPVGVSVSKDIEDDRWVRMRHAFPYVLPPWCEDELEAR